MRVSISEEGRSRPPHTNFDPVLNFINHGDFEEISSRHQEYASRVLRCDRFGLSIYINFPDQHTPPCSRYVVAYEGDNGHRKIQQTILQSNRSDAVLDLLDLINEHTRCLCKQLLEKKSVSNGKAVISKMRRIGNFHRLDVRRRIRKSLIAISQARFNDNAYRGFVNAVKSGVDDWAS